jgi:hypothetical protein
VDIISDLYQPIVANGRCECHFHHHEASAAVADIDVDQSNGSREERPVFVDVGRLARLTSQRIVPQPFPTSGVRLRDLNQGGAAASSL